MIEEPYRLSAITADDEFFVLPKLHINSKMRRELNELVSNSLMQSPISKELNNLALQLKNAGFDIDRIKAIKTNSAIFIECEKFAEKMQLVNHIYFRSLFGKTPCSSILEKLQEHCLIKNQGVGKLLDDLEAFQSYAKDLGLERKLIELAALASTYEKQQSNSPNSLLGRRFSDWRLE